MGQTIVEKILSLHSDRNLQAGDTGICKVDFCFFQDKTAGNVLNNLSQVKIPRNSKKYAMFMDHNSPSSWTAASEIHTRMRSFSRNNKSLAFDIGCGISGQLIIERGIAYPGRFILGADSRVSTLGALAVIGLEVEPVELAKAVANGETMVEVPHTYKIIIKGKVPAGVYGKDIILYLIHKLTCRGAEYKAVEFAGETISRLSLEERLTITNMALDLGAGCAVIAADRKVYHYLGREGINNPKQIYADKDCDYEKVIEFDISKLSPYIARPHSVDNGALVSERENIKINEAYLGTCANGRLSDLKIAAEILKGKRIHKEVKFLVAPASQRIFLEALKKGYVRVILEAGGIILPAGCGPCSGVHQGVPADGDVVISSGNQNFKGCMGNLFSFVYLASPATVTVSAITGKVTDPRKYIKNK